MKSATVSKKLSIAAVALLFIILGYQNLIYAQDDLIRIDSNLVTVPVTVLDRDGRYATNLKKENFQVFEDGVEQETAFFETTEQPFTVLLLLDTSGSMSNNMAELANTASIFVKQLRPDDQLLAASFTDEIDVLFQITKVKDLRKAIKLRRKPRDGNTIIYDAVKFAQKKLKKISGRKAIILFSDGQGSGFDASAKDNLRDAEEQETLIYTVQFKPFFSEPPSYVNKKEFYKSIAEANDYMRDLAKVTGGRNYRIENIGDLGKTFSQIAEELGQQYSLGYYPKQSGKNGERRQIKVKVNQPNLAVRARDSYIVGASEKKRK